MSIAFLKMLNSKLPDFVKIAFGPIIRNKLINNEVFLNQYNELKKMDTSTSVDIEKNQFEKLKSVLIHAYEHTVYYRNIFDKVGFNVYSFTSLNELNKIPIINKNLIIKHFDELQADDISDFYSATTGGSTGTPLKIHLDRDSIYREKAFIYHFWEQLGYDYRHSRIASFRGTDFNGKNFKINPLYNEVQVNPCNINSSTINDYYKKLRKYKVDFLHGFPSAIYSFCKFAKEANLPVLGVYKAVFFISENVYDYQRDFIEKTLGCPSAAFFGHSERAVFAEQVKNEGYRFNNYYGFWELSKNDYGNIICTGFLNKKMPLIRYELDDSAQKKSSFYRITGHRNGFLYGKNNEIISGAALEVHSTILDKISNYQFVQTKKEYATVMYIPFKPLNTEECNRLRELFQTKVGNALTIEIQEVQQMILTERGKFNLIIQRTQDNFITQ